MKAFFVSIPHSGEMIPKEATWLLELPEVLKMYDVDRFVDILYTPSIEKLKLRRRSEFSFRSHQRRRKIFAWASLGDHHGRRKAHARTYLKKVA